MKGAADLWASFVDLYGEHFFTVDVTNVSLAASSNSLTGVPADCFRVNLIEPRDMTATGPYRGLSFFPRKYNHPDFVAARSMAAIDPNLAGTIFYDVTQAGPPVGTPTILTAPQITAALDLRFVYNPTLTTSGITTASNNPIPGESDQALIAYMVAFARAKERDDRSPDPNWVAVYATEKQSLLTRSTPRQDQEPEVVDGIFDDIYYNY
jgi:hypothetical protein